MLVGPRTFYSIYCWLLATSLALVGCQEKPAEKEPVQSSPAPAELSTPLQIVPQNPIGQVNIPPAAAITDDLVVAASHCQCSPRFMTALMVKSATMGGALPEILVPDVREQIKNDPRLQTLGNLPPALGNVLGKIFANDEKISQEVHKGLLQKMSSFVPQAGALSGRLPFRFDLFTTPTVPSSGQTAPQNGFALQAQAARWMAVWSLQGMWNGSAPIEGSDHSLQLLETLRTLSEWNYLFGLPSKGSGINYGGLSLDPVNGFNKIAGIFDPRVDPQAKRFFSGSYAVTLPAASSLVELAKASEQWSVSGTQVSLTEQAWLWESAALAFSKMRKDHRTHTAALFTSLLPDNAHELPLAFLKTIEALLSGSFINATTREISSQARLGGGAGTPATLQDLTFLALALKTWVGELRQAQTAGVSADTTNQLLQASQSLNMALQLTTQTILGRYSRVVTENGRYLGVALVQSNGQELRDPSVVPMVIYTLASIDKEVMNSPFMREKVIGLLHWYARSVFPYLTTTQNANLKAQDFMWTYLMLQKLEEYGPQTLQVQWVSEAKTALGQALAGWGG